jgi:hypothetical protein
MPFGEKDVPKRPSVEAPPEGKTITEPLKVDFDAVYLRQFFLCPTEAHAQTLIFGPTDLYRSFVYHDRTDPVVRRPNGAAPRTEQRGAKGDADGLY